MFNWRKPREPQLPDLLGEQEGVTRRGLLAGGGAAVALLATGCTSPAPTSPATSSPSPKRTTSSASPPPANPELDENGFVIKSISLLDKTHRRGNWRTYIDREKASGGGYYVDSQAKLEFGKGAVLEGSVAPADEPVPPDLDGSPRARCSMMYLDQPFTYGRVTIRAKFPSGKLPFHAVLMLWPHDDNWSEGELDVIEAISKAMSTMSSNIHYGTDHLHDPISSDEIPDDHRFHDYTIEWSPKGVFIYMDGKLINQVGPDQISTNPKRITVQADVDGITFEPGVNMPDKGSESVIQVSSVEFQAYMGIGHQDVPDFGPEELIPRTLELAA